MLEKLKQHKIIISFGLILLLLGIIIALIFSLNKEQSGNNVDIDDITTSEETEGSGSGHTQTVDSYNEWKEEVGTTYDEFTEEDENKAEKAVELAKEYYLNKHSEIRETSVFYAESFKGEIYRVVGIDSIDGRDVRFGEFQVNLENQEVKEIDYLKSN